MRRLLGVFLSPAGRLGRKTFWLAYAAQSAAVVAVAVLAAGLEADDGSTRAPVAIALTLVSLSLGWINLVLGAKRLRDRGRPGWHALAGFVPVVGGAWVLSEGARRSRGRDEDAASLQLSSTLPAGISPPALGASFVAPASSTTRLQNPGSCLDTHL